MFRSGTLMHLPWRSLRKPARHPGASWPPSATQWLLGATALSLTAQWFLLRLTPAPATEALKATAALSAHGLLTGHCWQPLTYLFLTSGQAGLDFGALLALYLLGSQLEFIIGRRHLFQVYFLAGAFGGCAQLAYDAASNQPAALAGSSAAVLGLLLALTSVMPNLELAPLLGFPLPFWLKIKHASLVVVSGCVVLAVAAPQNDFSQQQAVRCLAGALLGCIYMRQLGFGLRIHAPHAPPELEPMLQIPVFSQAAEPPAPAEAAQALPRFTERERRMTPRQYISEQIDPILDKISLHGIGCLTPAERRVLEKGRDKISQGDV
jgi:membrane associated rhomboid family serine protease